MNALQSVIKPILLTVCVGVVAGWCGWLWACVCGFCDDGAQELFSLRLEHRTQLTLLHTHIHTHTHREREREPSVCFAVLCCGRLCLWVSTDCYFSSFELVGEVRNELILHQTNTHVNSMQPCTKT